MKGQVKIDIAGKQVICQFGMYAIKMLTEKRKISYSELFELISALPEEKDLVKSFDFLVDLIWSGMLNYNFINEVDEVVKYPALYNDVATVDPAKYSGILEAFFEASVIGKAVGDSNEGLDQPAQESKKK